MEDKSANQFKVNTNGSISPREPIYFVNGKMSLELTKPTDTIYTEAHHIDFELWDHHFRKENGYHSIDGVTVSEEFFWTEHDRLLHPSFSYQKEQDREAKGLVNELSATETKCYDQGKPALLDVFNWLDDSFLLSMVDVMKEGAKKYSKDNWKGGTWFSRRLNSALRHLVQYSRGEDIDEELKTNHLAMAAVNLMMVYYWQVNTKGTDDRPKEKA